MSTAADFGMTELVFKRGKQIDKVYQLYEESCSAFSHSSFAKATNRLVKLRDYLNSINLPRKKPIRECDRFEDVTQADALHKAFVEHCNGCDCPMGCILRKDTRFMLDTNCNSILKCFAQFVLSKATTKGAR